MSLEGLEYITIENQTTEFPKHFHDTFCVSLIYKGIEQIDFENHSLFSEAGTISITNPYEIHSNPLFDKEAQLKFDTIYIPNELVKKVLNGKPIKFVNRKINEEKANRLFVKLKEAICQQQVENTALILSNFISVLKHYSIEIQEDYFGLDFNSYKQINNYIENNIYNKFSLEQLSKIANINKYGFAKKFKLSTGMTPINYILMKKVFSSKTLISQNVELTEIAYEYNFTDLAHFSKTFKRFVGVSPRIYQQSLTQKKKYQDYTSKKTISFLHLENTAIQMKKTTQFSFFFLLISSFIFSQSIDDSFSKRKMRKDLETFKKIRKTSNSGLYKYRSKNEIDSIYSWADNQIKKSSTYRDFYNIISQLTDFEGSAHNSTSFPDKIRKTFKNEKSGYFPYPIKWIEGKWIINYEKGEIPLGSEILSINNEKIDDIIKNLSKYFATDGINKTGKRIALNIIFSRYYRLHFGLKDKFVVIFKKKNLDKTEVINLKSIGHIEYIENVKNRFSKPFDQVNYKDWEADEIYSNKQVDNKTGLLTINSFGMGSEEDQGHLDYLSFLDSTFRGLKTKNINNLIVDVRYNSGGTDPNDLVTYSYLTNRSFSENKEAWISFYNIPHIRYIESKWPSFLRFLKIERDTKELEKELQKEFSKKLNDKFYQDENSSDHKIRIPNKNAFNGKVYLLISPRVASAGSLFAAMLAGNKKTTIIGEESLGGYYGHNGHYRLRYVLPKSKLRTSFSIVNLEQDVPKKENQIYNRGIIPDFKVNQTFQDYLNHEDTQINYVLDLINSTYSK